MPLPKHHYQKPVWTARVGPDGTLSYHDEKTGGQKWTLSAGDKVSNHEVIEEWEKERLNRWKTKTLTPVKKVDAAGERATTNEIQAAIKDDGEAQGTAMDPDSDFMEAWDLFIMILLAYTATITPFEVGYLGDPVLNLLFFANRLVDVGFMVDMYFQFQLGYMHPLDQIMIWDKGKIAKRYFRTWFAVDLLSVVPFDIISFLFTAMGATGSADAFRDLKVVRVIRLLRLVKLVRLLRSARIVARQQAKLGWSNVTYALAKYVCACVAIIHWISCFWGVGTNMIIPDTLGGMHDGSLIDWKRHIDMPTPDPADQYCVGIEFAVSVLGFGYASAEPHGTSQRALAEVCMFVGGGFFTYMIGAICTALSGIDPAQTEYKQTIDTLNLYLDDIRLTPDKRPRYREYFMKAKNMMRHHFYRDVLENLSPGLKGQIAIHCHRDWLSKIPFFNCSDEDERDRFVVEVARKLSRACFTIMEEICTMGEPAAGMYIIMSGLVGCAGAVRRAGTYFGTDMIRGGGVSGVNANAITFVDAQLLKRAALIDLLHRGRFPKTMRLVRKAAFRLCLSAFVRDIGQKAASARKRQGKQRLAKETPVDLEEWKKNIRIRRAEKKKRSAGKEANYDPTRVDTEGIAARLRNLGDDDTGRPLVSFATQQLAVLSQTAGASFEDQLDELKGDFLTEMDECMAHLEAKIDPAKAGARVVTRGVGLKRDKFRPKGAWGRLRRGVKARAVLGQAWIAVRTGLTKK